MTTDPDEGVTAGNLITTGVRSDRISAEFRPLLSLVTSKLASLDPDVVAVYLYGSVATGRATPPASDLDLLVVLATGGAETNIQSFAHEVSGQHMDLVREVAIATVVFEEIWSNTPRVSGFGVSSSTTVCPFTAQT